jgi:hypothetical protein
VQLLLPSGLLDVRARVGVRVGIGVRVRGDE